MYFAAVASSHLRSIESLAPAAWSAPVSLLSDAELATRAYLGSEVANARRTARSLRRNRTAGVSPANRRFAPFSFSATR